MSGLPELCTNLIATLTSLNWNEFTHGWNREQVWTGRLGDWLVPKGKHMCHNLQSNIQVTYLKHLQHVGNEIKKIFLYFIPVGPVGLMELWRVVHREGVCSKWANLFPFSPHGGLFVPCRTNDRKGEVHVWPAAARSSLDQDKIETCTDMQRIVIASHSHFMQKPSKTTEGYILESDYLITCFERNG